MFQIIWNYFQLGNNSFKNIMILVLSFKYLLVCAEIYLGAGPFIFSTRNDSIHHVEMMAALTAYTANNNIFALKIIGKREFSSEGLMQIYDVNCLRILLHNEYSSTMIKLVDLVATWDYTWEYSPPVLKLLMLLFYQTTWLSLFSHLISFSLWIVSNHE